ncbi:hypothetical protein LQV63_16670 [Paenibacillus profundus]|uniref:Uncharacterized protein n=1 Tax=Paenibacillus profundus TaxID=1173085 RepID=A0ABS8YKQ9_9BACL|nr:hypothetical protein [Paenibacillus profundus]
MKLRRATIGLTYRPGYLKGRMKMKKTEMILQLKADYERYQEGIYLLDGAVPAKLALPTK